MYSAQTFAMLVQHRGIWRACKDPTCFKGEHTVKDFIDRDVCDRGVPIDAVDKKGYQISHGSWLTSWLTFGNEFAIVGGDSPNRTGQAEKANCWFRGFSGFVVIVDST